MAWSRQCLCQSQNPDAEGGLWKYDFDQRGNIIETIDPLENKTQSDALRQRTTWHYNEAGLIQQRQDANGTTLDYRWDRLGQLLELRNENNSTARFKYDPAGRLLKETGFDQQTTHYLYDHGSNQPTRRLDGDRVNEFEYDPMGRLIARHAGHKEGLEWQTETRRQSAGSIRWR